MTSPHRVGPIECVRDTEGNWCLAHGLPWPHSFIAPLPDCTDTMELLRRVVMDYAPDDCPPDCYCSAAQARRHLRAAGEQR